MPWCDVCEEFVGGRIKQFKDPETGEIINVCMKCLREKGIT